MHTNLVRASREEMRPQEIDGFEAREPGQICPCRPSTTDDRHARSVSWIAADRPLDRQAILSQVPPRQHGVPPGDLARLEGRTQDPVCPVRLGDEQESRRLLVEAV